MKERILTNWTFGRALYLILGIVIMVHSVMIQQWFGLFFGAYFASMGLFAFGCASGSCFGGNCAVETKPQSKAQDVSFEEIKTE